MNSSSTRVLLCLLGQALKLWVIKVVEKCSHSKINNDNSSTYQTQITAISAVRWAQPKPPSPISALQSISLSDCCQASLAPSCLILGNLFAGWSFCMPSLPPTCQTSVVGQMCSNWRDSWFQSWYNSSSFHPYFHLSIHLSWSGQNSTNQQSHTLERYTLTCCIYRNLHDDTVHRLGQQRHVQCCGL